MLFSLARVLHMANSQYSYSEDPLQRTYGVVQPRNHSGITGKVRCSDIWLGSRSDIHSGRQTRSSSPKRRFLLLRAASASRCHTFDQCCISP